MHRSSIRDRVRITDLYIDIVPGSSDSCNSSLANYVAVLNIDAINVQVHYEVGKLVIWIYAACSIRRVIGV